MRPSREGLEDFVREYLSPGHRDNRGDGVKDVYTGVARAIVEELAVRLAPEGSSYAERVCQSRPGDRLPLPHHVRWRRVRKRQPSHARGMAGTLQPARARPNGAIVG